MKHHYLIDYENVHEDGLTGLNTIEDDAVIHIFYSDRARKLDLDSFREGQILQIEALKVPVGKQSLDMQLVSYMGYLMGRERGEGNAYIIISKDNGYLNSIPFWKQIMRDGTTVEVRPQIRPRAVEEPKQEASAPQPQQEPAKPAAKAAPAEKQAPAAPQPPARPEKNDRRSRNGRGRGRNRRERTPEVTPAVETQEAQPAAIAAEAQEIPVVGESRPVYNAKAKAEPSVEANAEPVAEAKAEPAVEVRAEPVVEAKTESAIEVKTEPVVEAKAEPVVDVKTEPVVEAKAEPAVDVKTEPTVTAEPALKSEGEGKKEAKGRNRSSSKARPKKEASASLDRSALNTAVMQTLSKANIDAATTGKIASVVMKYAQDKHNKTMIYREIIRNHGQKNGLMMYNLIKSLL